MANKSGKVWKYEFLATGRGPGDFVVLSSGEFKAANLAATKSMLAGALTDIKAHGSVMPNTIRLIDPDGEEIWRALIPGPRPAVRRPAYEIRSDHPWPLARKKRQYY